MKEFILKNSDIIKPILIIWLITRLWFWLKLINEVIFNYDRVKNALQIKEENGTYYDQWSSNNINLFITLLSIYILYLL